MACNRGAVYQLGVFESIFPQCEPGYLLNTKPNIFGEWFGLKEQDAIGVRRYCVCAEKTAEAKYEIQKAHDAIQPTPSIEESLKSLSTTTILIIAAVIVAIIMLQRR